jgi:hypothetical protein
MFLPRRYADIFTDANVEGINLVRVRLNLVHKGQCTEMKSFKVEIEYDVHISLQMCLAARFEQVTSMSVLRVDQMEPERCYTIKLAELATALLGTTVLMIIEDGGKEHLTYLPRRYARSVNDEDIAMIKSARV